MRAMGMTMAVALGLSTAWLGIAEPAKSVQEDICAIQEALRGAPSSDALQLRQTAEGHCRFLGTPLGGYFDTNASGRAAGPETAARSFLSDHEAAFNVGTAGLGFNTVRVRSSGGRGMIRLQQTYGGVPVFAAQVNVQVNAANYVTSVLSDVTHRATNVTALSLTPTINAPTAQAVAVAAMNAEHPGYAFTASEPTLVVYDPDVIGAEGTVCLAWKTTVAATGAGLKEEVFVDAHSAQVAFHYSLIQEDKDRDIYDAQNTTADPGTFVRGEVDPATGDTEVDTAFDYLGDTYDFYLAEHGRDSIDDAGMTLSATVRYCYPYFGCPMQNAFWDGSRMYFGEGFVVDDVVAHELTHGVTSYESDLVYAYESGAINEAFSDIWGEFVDMTNGAGNDDVSVAWLMGEDLPIGAIRSMSDPTLFGDPDRMESPYYYTGSYDYGGVHTNCGVGSKLCYLLTDGDTFNGYTVFGMGISTVADLFYEAQTNILVAGSNYADLASALLEAGGTIGLSTNEIANIRTACLAVEILNESFWPFRAATVAGDPRVALYWAQPTSSTFQQVTLVRKTVSFPQAIGDGTTVYQGAATQFVDGPLPIGTEYFYTLFVTHTDASEDCLQYARVTVGDPTPNYLSEEFPAGSDLSFVQILFSPTGDATLAANSGSPAGYTNYTNYNTTVLRGPDFNWELPVDKDDSIQLPLPDDTWEYGEDPPLLAVDLPYTFPYFGTYFTRLLLSSNGYIATPDFLFSASREEPNFPSYEGHFDTRRISFLFADLAPSDGGEVWGKWLDDRFVVTFENVPEYGSALTNTVQIELFYSGHIRITYLELNVTECVCGIADGNGTPLDPLDIFAGAPTSYMMSDLSEDFGDNAFTIFPTIPAQEEDEGALIEFDVHTTAPEGSIPVFEMRPSSIAGLEYPNPLELSLVNNGDGSASFSWQSGPDSDGKYGVLICARLGDEIVCQDVAITLGNVYAEPIAVDLTIVPTAPGPDDALYGSYTYFQLQGLPESTPRIQWYRNGAVVLALNDTLIVPPQATAPGDNWYFTVVPIAILEAPELGSEFFEGASTLSDAVIVSATGDANGDGVVNAVDLQLVVNGVLGLDTEGAMTDLNGDGVTDSSDVMWVIRAMLQI